MPVVKKVDVDLILTLTIFFGSLLKSKYPLEVWFNVTVPVPLTVNVFIRSHPENKLSLKRI